MMDRIVFPIAAPELEQTVLNHFNEFDLSNCVTLVKTLPSPDHYYKMAKRVVEYAREPGDLFLVVDNRWEGLNAFLVLVTAKIMARKGGNRKKFRIIEVNESGYIRTLMCP